MGRIQSLTSLRFCAAFAVCVFHLAVLGAFPMAPVSGMGAGPVSFFFVLSGFILTWSHRSDDTWPRFWRRRAARIYPSHIATLLLVLAFLMVLGAPLDLGTLAANLFLVQAWSPDGATVFSFNGVSWSLSCEVLFYLAFPLLIRVVNRISRPWLGFAAVVAAIWCAAAFIDLFGARLGLPPGPQLLAHPWQEFWPLYVFPATRLLEFVLGMIAARIVREGLQLAISTRTATIVLAAAYAVELVVTGPFRLTAILVVPMTLLIQAAATADLRGTPSVLRAPFLVSLGELSFAFYLGHGVLTSCALILFAGRTWTPLGASAFVAVFLLLSFALAWALHRFVERPGMRLARRSLAGVR